MEVESVGKSVMCLLEDPQGNPLESPMFLPLTFGPQHLLQVVNQLLNNVSFMHIFFFSFVVLMLKTKIVEIQDDMGCSFLYVLFIYSFCISTCQGGEVAIRFLCVRQRTYCAAWCILGEE